MCRENLNTEEGAVRGKYLNPEEIEGEEKF